MTRRSDAAGPAGDVTRVDWRVRLGVPVGLLVLRTLAATWRFRTRGAARWRADDAAGMPTLMALWHGHLLPLGYFMRNRGIEILVSEHRDGEVIARVLHRLGHRTIRGSTTRGGARALAEMIRALKAGRTVAITPDGPRGPARTMAPGVLVAAQRAGATVTTLYVTVNRAWRLKSWDSFMIPKPFATVTVHFGDPTRVTGSTPAEAEAQVARFEAMLAERRDVPDV
ncbi:MAG TPA: lysophospholipid acyltransferase family protein [Gemmatimonadaceae bacterium]|nr:lysophospholipid acyltransferase family protein [Gemmatimonadaceae bacterium]